MNGEKTFKPAHSIEELLAYARVMERAAALRYKELAEIMTTHNNREVSELFRRMSENEWLHVQSVDALSQKMAVDIDGVQLSSADRLLGAEVPQFEELHYLHSAHHAVKIARQYERNAYEFYVKLADAAKDEQLRSTALQLAEEEKTHVQELDRWLLRYPEPDSDWDEDMDPPASID